MDFFSQFSPIQMYNGYLRSLHGVKKMEEKALSTGKKVNGYTLQGIREMVATYETKVSEWKQIAGV